MLLRFQSLSNYQKRGPPLLPIHHEENLCTPTSSQYIQKISESESTANLSTINASSSHSFHRIGQTINNRQRKKNAKYVLCFNAKPQKKQQK